MRVFAISAGIVCLVLTLTTSTAGAATPYDQDALTNLIEGENLARMAWNNSGGDPDLLQAYFYAQVAVAYAEYAAETASAQYWALAYEYAFFAWYFADRSSSDYRSYVADLLLQGFYYSYLACQYASYSFSNSDSSSFWDSSAGSSYYSSPYNSYYAESNPYNNYYYNNGNGYNGYYSGGGYNGYYNGGSQTDPLDPGLNDNGDGGAYYNW